MRWGRVGGSERLGRRLRGLHLESVGTWIALAAVVVLADVRVAGARGEGIAGLEAGEREHITRERSPAAAAPRAVFGKLVDQREQLVPRDPPELRGRVVDGQGRPLPGVELTARPRRDGEPVTSLSGAQGEFALPVRVHEPHSIVARLEGYESAPAAYHELDEPCEIVLSRADQAQFVVVDDETGQPVEEFGLRSWRSERGSLLLVFADWQEDLEFQSLTSRGSQPPIEQHPGGQASLAREPDRGRFGLLAPDYLPVIGEIARGPEGSTRQVVRLKRGAGLHGVVLHGGRPVAGASVRIESVRWWERASSSNPFAGLIVVVVDEVDGTESMQPAEETGTAPRREPSFWVDGDVWIERVTEMDGSFGVRGLSAGTYRVEIRGPRGLSTELVAVRVDEGRDVQLGSILLHEPGSISGRVLTPPGISARGIAVLARDENDRKRNPAPVRTGPGGEFRFEGLRDGLYTLRVGAVTGQLGEGKPTWAAVRKGVSPEVTLDASSNGLCALNLELRFTVPVQQQLEAFLIAEEGANEVQLTSFSSRDRTLEGFFPALGMAYVEIRTRAGMVFRQPAEGLELNPLASVQRTLSFPAGALELQLPEEIEFPDRGEWIVRLHPTTAALVRPEQELTLSSSREDSRDGRDQAQVDVMARRVHIALVPAGAYRVELEVFDYGTKRQRLGNDEQGEPRWGREPRYRGECMLTIPDGGLGRGVVE